MSLSCYRIYKKGVGGFYPTNMQKYKIENILNL
nr:MAG TPA: protein of unknown function (DUF5062) [Caudoviricetes sp.]